MSFRHWPDCPDGCLSGMNTNYILHEAGMIQARIMPVFKLLNFISSSNQEKENDLIVDSVNRLLLIWLTVNTINCFQSLRRGAAMEKQTINELINEYEELSIYTTNKIQEAVEEIVRKHKITFEQLCILRILETRPGISPVQMASRLNVNKSGLSIRIHRLLDRGLIEKKPIDNRSFGLHNTDEGRKIFREGHEKIQQLVGHWIQLLGEKDSKEFIRIYKKINKIIAKLRMES
ncbi:MarR family transcriptional regulator [Sporolactobacillus sp. THM7-7]|nr:MarR family transcriptional regulator [Sporolactobacillus sp. THM7-7]